jgi:hypothetical protein
MGRPGTTLRNVSRFNTLTCTQPSEQQSSLINSTFHMYISNGPSRAADARRDSIGKIEIYVRFNLQNWNLYFVQVARMKNLRKLGRRILWIRSEFWRRDRPVDHFQVDGGLVMGGSLFGVVVRRFVVLETKLLLLHWHSHLFQSRLTSYHHVLHLLPRVFSLLNLWIF